MKLSAPLNSAKKNAQIFLSYLVELELSGGFNMKIVKFRGLVELSGADCTELPCKLMIITEPLRLKPTEFIK